MDFTILTLGTSQDCHNTAQEFKVDTYEAGEPNIEASHTFQLNLTKGDFLSLYLKAMATFMRRATDASPSL